MGLVDKSRIIPKSMAAVCVLDIIGEASEKNPVTQSRIRELLESNYGIRTDRKTVHRHLETIVESIDKVRYTEKKRTVNGEESFLMTDFWLEDESAFDDLELKALVYAVLFSRHIPTSYKKSLVAKLKALSPATFRRKAESFVFEDGSTADDFNELFLSMEIVEEAIDEGKMLSFKYRSYEVDKAMRASEEAYTVSPLGIGVRDGDFYLMTCIVFSDT